MMSRSLAVGIYVIILFAAVLFYNVNIIEHVHYIEGTAAAVAASLATMFFLILLFVPQRLKMFRLILGSVFAAIVFVAVIALIVRPYMFINTEIPARTALLEEHLEEEYPEESWTIEHSDPGEHSLYSMIVTFEGEDDTVYLYDMNDQVADGEEEIEAAEIIER